MAKSLHSIETYHCQINTKAINKYILLYHLSLFNLIYHMQCTNYNYKNNNDHNNNNSNNDDNEIDNNVTVAHIKSER